MFYDGYHFWGMHLLWWFIWITFIFWILATPYSISGRRFKPYTPLDILKRRFASGEISNDDYLEKKKMLENN